MKNARLSVYTAQIMLARLIGLALIFPLIAVFATATAEHLSVLLALMLLGMVPPAAVLALLFAGQRRLAVYVALLCVPITILVFLAFASPLLLGSFGSGSALQAVLGLPFLYSGITLARVSSSVRLTAEERHEARKLRASRGSSLVAPALPQEHPELYAAP